MPISTYLFKCFCCPCILFFYAIRILCCGCIGVCCKGLGLCITSACCWLWETVFCNKCGCTRVYSDNIFKPSLDAIGTIDGADQVTWERLEEYCGGPDKAVLVNGGISPKEIAQGDVGNCWLLSSMAALAEFPALVRDVFVIQQQNSYQKYCFRLFDEQANKFREITVDTLIPMVDGKPMFLRPHGTSMWAPLLEKAVAKLMGGYSNMDFGTIEGGIRLLTGATLVRIRKPEIGDMWERNNGSKLYKGLEIHDLVRNFDYHKAIMACSITKEISEEKLKGLERAHAYTLIGAYIFQNIRLFKLRNPWGCGEWRGDWCDNSPLWNQYPQLAKALKFVNADDGVFFMEEKDFINTYDYIVMGVRDSGFNDIAYEPNEGSTCGACAGLASGCCGYWCCCGGCKALCCGQVADAELEKYEDLC